MSHSRFILILSFLEQADRRSGQHAAGHHELGGVVGLHLVVQRADVGLDGVAEGEAGDEHVLVLVGVRGGSRGRVGVGLLG